MTLLAKPSEAGGAPRPARRSWTWIALSSAAVAVVALVTGAVVSFSPLEWMAGLFVGGLIAGALSTRQAWLSGIIVGLPFSAQQLTRLALAESPSVGTLLAQPDFWIIAVPVSVMVTGIAIAGGLTGAWVAGGRLGPR